MGSIPVSIGSSKDCWRCLYNCIRRNLCAFAFDVLNYLSAQGMTIKPLVNKLHVKKEEKHKPSMNEEIFARVSIKWSNNNRNIFNFCCFREMMIPFLTYHFLIFFFFASSSSFHNISCSWYCYFMSRNKARDNRDLGWNTVCCTVVYLQGWQKFADKINSL